MTRPGAGCKPLRMADPTIPELEAELAEVDAAIKAARTGSSYAIGGRSLTRQDLPSLHQDRARLRREIRELEAAAAGAEAPMSRIATWNP